MICSTHILAAALLCAVSETRAQDTEQPTYSMSQVGPVLVISGGNQSASFAGVREYVTSKGGIVGGSTIAGRPFVVVRENNRWNYVCGVAPAGMPGNWKFSFCNWITGTDCLFVMELGATKRFVFGSYSSGKLNIEDAETEGIVAGMQKRGVVFEEYID